MTKALFFIILILLAPTACDSQDSTQEEDAQNLEKMFLKIKNLAGSIICESAADWTFTDYGSKACGGPQGYIAYSKDLDTVQFLGLIKEHKTAEKDFNNKWGIVSDCSLPAEPTGVICDNGEPVFTY